MTDTFKKNLVNDAILILSSAYIGYFSWVSCHGHLILLLFIPLLWIMASNRYTAYLVFYVYLMLASRGLIEGATIFLSETHHYLQAVALCLVKSLLGTFPFLIFWHSQPTKKSICLALAFVFTYIVPPFSLVGVANPIIAGAAALLPTGAGFLGLLVILAFILASCLSRRVLYTFSCVIVIAAALNFNVELKPIKAQDFYAVNTSLGRLASGSFNFADDFDRAMLVFSDLRHRRLSGREETFVLLPETIAGRSNRTNIDLWTNEIRRIIRSDQTVFWGGEIPREYFLYDNVIFMYHAGNTKYIAQRVPVPYSMYKGPFAESGARLHYFNSGVIALPDGRRAAMLICYETFLTWPILRSMFERPDILLTASNLWWCRDTNLPEIQSNHVNLWSRLFGIPTASAVNM